MALCLICKEIKDYNLKRHCIQKHAAKFDAYQGMLHKDKILELSKGLSPQENIYKEVKTQLDFAIKSSYGIANLIAKNQSHFLDVHLLSNAWMACLIKQGIFLRSFCLT